MIVSPCAKPARTVLIGSAEEVRPPSAKADLLNKAASKIDTGENDIDLAAALMECAALADDDGLLLVICAKSPYAS